MKITKPQYYAFIAFVERSISLNKEVLQLRKHGLEFIGVKEDSDMMWAIEELFFSDNMDIIKINECLKHAKIEVVE